MNVLAIVIAVVANMIIGAAWYSQALFGKHWMKHWMAHTKSSKKDLGKAIKPAHAMIGGACISIIMNMVIATLFEKFSITGFANGLLYATLFWLVFAALTMHDVFFENKPWQLHAIHSGHILFMLLSSGLILAGW